MPAGQLTKAIRNLRRILGAPTGADLNDRQLLERFADANDQEAFTTLVHRHGPLVWGVCRRVLDNEADAEDCFQATFWILARKARWVRWHDSVANWLYGVAFRTAQRARAKAGLRRRREQEAGAMNPSAAANAGNCQELSVVLDEELMQLPAKYRMPLLLCYLHGKTRDEAAEELGWSVGAVKGSLERGRDLLRDRLARRGLTLSAALLGSLLAKGTVTAAPAALVNATVTAVTTGTMAAPTAALAKGVIQAMYWTKVKLVASLVVVSCLLVAGAGAAHYYASSKRNSSPAVGNGQPVEVALAPLPNAIEARADGQPAWGTPHGGLRMGLAPARLELRPDDRSVRLKVWFENVGTKPQPVPLHKLTQGAATNTCLFTFRATRGGKVYFSHYLVSRDELIGPEMATLMPGQRVADEFECRIAARPQDGEGFFFENTQKEERTLGLPELAAGESLNLQVGWAVAHGIWSEKEWTAMDTLTSGTITVARAPAPPLVKDGLAVSVKPMKAAFTTNELPAFQVSYENRTEKTLRLNDVGYELSYFQFTPLDGKEVWQGFPRSHLYRQPPLPAVPNGEPGQRKARTPVSAPVEPGKNLVSEFVVEGKVEQPGQTRDSLPPGKYRMTAVIKFQEGNEKDSPYWVGQVTTNPVEFEVVEPKPAGDAKASEPAVKDGLAITVKPAKTSFAPGELLAFDVTFKNETKEAFAIAGAANVIPPGKLQFTARGDGSVLRANPPVGTAPGGQLARQVVLAAGQEQTVRWVIGKSYGVAWNFTPEKGDGKKVSWPLPAGKYAMTCTYANDARNNERAPTPNGEPLWVGTFTTKAVEFEIAEKSAKASEPAVKDGLAVSVAPLQAAFGPEEPLAFKVTYTNVGKTAFVLKDADYLWNRDIDCTDVGTKSEWTFRPLFRCTTNNTVTTLEPGKSVEATLRLNPTSKTYPYEFFTAGGRMERKTARLAPGSYRLTVGLEFTAAEKPGDGASPAWVGKVLTNPVEFQVVDEKPASGRGSAPIAKDGLLVTVLPAKGVFAPADPLEFEVSLKNLTAKPFILLSPNAYAYNWQVLVKDVKSGESLESNFLVPKIERPEIPVTVQAGESTTVAVVLRDKLVGKDVNIVYRTPGPQPQKREALGPGQYELRLIVKFEAATGKYATPVWAGEVTTNPVPFTIGEAKAGPRQGNSSEKGWELYARFEPVKKEWRFALMEGTNRQKTAKEIAAAHTIVEVGALKTALSRLAEGQEVYLLTPVPEALFKEIQDHCTREKLGLEKAVE